MISRRQVLFGFGAIAAPFVIRTPGILMPVKYRPPLLSAEELRDLTMYGLRDWHAYPPSLEEVIDWRRCRQRMDEQGTLVSWTAAGMMEICALGDAERRYEAMGIVTAINAVPCSSMRLRIS